MAEAKNITKLIPSLVTVVAICFGLSAIRYSLDGRFELSLTLIVVAALLDAVDGRLARSLNATSPFGAQLDSVADFVNFSIAPPFILYLWTMSDIKAFGWAVVLIFAVCGAIRLARFNVEEDCDSAPSAFFSGIPSPAAALLALWPLAVGFGLRDVGLAEEFSAVINFISHPLFVCIYTIILALYMVSRLPTISWKNVSIRADKIGLPHFVIIFIIASLFTQSWLTLSIIGIWYVGSLPVTYMRSRKDAISSK